MSIFCVYVGNGVFLWVALNCMCKYVVSWVFMGYRGHCEGIFCILGFEDKIRTLLTNWNSWSPYFWELPQVATWACHSRKDWKSWYFHFLYPYGSLASCWSSCLTGTGQVKVGVCIYQGSSRYLSWLEGYFLFLLITLTEVMAWPQLIYSHTSTPALFI